MQNDDPQIALYLDLVTERMIPPEGPWPSAVDLRTGEDVLGHLRESERRLIVEALSELASYADFKSMSGHQRDSALHVLEQQNPPAFALVRQIAYLSYYAQPAVVTLLQEMGYDINATPGPNGYHMDPFSVSHLPMKRRGTWIPTEQVKIRTERRVS